MLHDFAEINASARRMQEDRSSGGNKAALASIALASQSWLLVFYQPLDEASDFFLASNSFFFSKCKTAAEIKSTKEGGGVEGE